jgi:hypothetical protein
VYKNGVFQQLCDRNVLGTRNVFSKRARWAALALWGRKKNPQSIGFGVVL